MFRPPQTPVKYKKNDSYTKTDQTSWSNPQEPEKEKKKEESSDGWNFKTCPRELKRLAVTETAGSITSASVKKISNSNTTYWLLIGQLVWITKSVTAEMPREFRGKNCVGGAPEGNVWASEKYIILEVFNPGG